MTKKRFVKLLMSKRVERNAAYAIAYAVYKTGDSYKDWWDRNKTQISIWMLKKYIVKVWEGVREVVKQIREAIKPAATELIAALRERKMDEPEICQEE